MKTSSSNVPTPVAANVIAPMLRIKEAAEILRTSDMTVRRLITEGKLTSVKVRGLRLVPD